MLFTKEIHPSDTAGPFSRIEVFKTNVLEPSEAKKIVALLVLFFPGTKINFDLHDCDKILRVEGRHFSEEKIIRIVKENGYTCSVLE